MDAFLSALVLVANLVCPASHAEADGTTRSFKEHTGSVLAVTFSQDGKMQATSSRDGSIRLWNPQTGKSDRMPSKHDGDIYTVVISPRSDVLASAGKDATVILWNSAGEVLRTLKEHTDIVRSAAFSSDQ